MTEHSDESSEPRLLELAVEPLSAAAFAPFGTVISPGEDGTPFGPEDAVLELTAGTPRFYIMSIPGRGLTIRGITRHRKVTQTLAAVGGLEWTMAVAAPKDVDVPEASPALADIRAFRIPGNVAVMLHRGSWHAGPLFEGGERSFFNLELSDTNETDHHTCMLTKQYGVALKLVG